MALCGGNRKDNGTPATKKFEWMGNEDELSENQLHSRFDYLLDGRPITSQLIRDMGEAAALDLLDCFSAVGAKDIKAAVQETERNKMQVVASIEMNNGQFEHIRAEVFPQ